MNFPASKLRLTNGSVKLLYPLPENYKYDAKKDVKNARDDYSFIRIFDCILHISRSLRATDIYIYIYLIYRWYENDINTIWAKKIGRRMSDF